MVLGAAFKNCILDKYNRILATLNNDCFSDELEVEIIKIELKFITQMVFDYGKFLGEHKND